MSARREEGEGREGSGGLRKKCKKFLDWREWRCGRGSARGEISWLVSCRWAKRQYVRGDFGCEPDALDDIQCVEQYKLRIIVQAYPLDMRFENLDNLLPILRKIITPTHVKVML